MLRVQTSRTGKLLDCVRLRVVDPVLPERIIQSIVGGDSPVNVTLRLRSNLTEPESRAIREQMVLYEMLDKSIRRYGELAKRETGVHALWFGYPLIYASADVEEGVASILAPVFLWPISIEPDLRHEGCIRIGFAPNAGGPRFNLAMSTWIRRQLDVELSAPDEEQMIDLDWEGVKEYTLALAGHFRDSPSINFAGPLQPVPVCKELAGGRSPLLFNSAFLGYCRWQHEAILADLESLGSIEQYPEVAGSFITGTVLSEPAEGKPPSEEDRYVVCQADFSQEQVIWQARNGPGLVVHGPPGTGKSQTIVNVIADALAHGRKVLMVSQKQAATSVVLERLRAIGLADLCLEVHDAEGDRLTVFNAIREQAGLLPREAPHRDRDTRRKLARQITELEAVLDDYAKALHQKHPELGLSYREMKALEGKTYAEFPSVRTLSSLHSALCGVSNQELDSLTRRIAAVGCLFKCSDALRNPWRFRQASVRMSASLRSDVQSFLAELRALHAKHQAQVQRDGAGIALPADIAGFANAAPEVIAALQPLLRRKDSPYAKLLRAWLQYAQAASGSERQQTLASCQTLADLALEVESNQPDPEWAERCREMTKPEMRKLRGRVQKVLAWQAKPLRFLSPAFLLAARGIRGKKADAVGDDLWSVCDRAVRHLHALDVRVRLADANRNLPIRLKPTSESDDVQVSFARVTLESLKTALWINEKSRAFAWLDTLVSLVLATQHDSQQLSDYVRELGVALRRAPVAMDLLQALERFECFLRPEGLDEPRSSVLAGQ
ncbi:MAG TPA: AAA domain-containing protein, partial [Planctomycetota bacterium]|nr:AAA domain-containing protein [Planctomycetota bacterium]